ncbi:hypothetical protein DL98DRAFT_585382 [Cadophora sp. DSE1049]|nr:hypothetical protein DL98DRAFT_585382 [Cadophora sp. DSE1049]
MRSSTLLLGMSLAVLSHPLIVEHSTISNNPIQAHNDPLHGLQFQDVTIQILNPVSHSIQKRDSVTIHIESAFHHTSVANTQNNAKFQVINNAKNANIAVGDHSTHPLDFDSFGDKNMLNSTGSNTGGWNTKNDGSNLTTGRYGKLMIRRDKRHQSSGSLTRRTVQPLGKRDLVNLDIKGGMVKNSNITRSGNGNTVEVYVAGNGQNVVNITLSWEAEDSNMEDSNSENTIKVYVGDATGVEMGNSTVLVASGP